MEFPNESRINDDQFIQTSISDVSLWEKSPTEACSERSDVVDGIVRNQRADYLGVVVEHGWDVNEMLRVHGSGRGRVKRTALHHAVFYRWHEGARLLLNAGADCNIKCEWSGEADFSVSPHFPRDLHFGPNTREHTPLCIALYKDDAAIVKLLLQDGADLKDNDCDYIAVNLDRLRRPLRTDDCRERKQKENCDVLNELLTNGMKVRRNLDEHLQSLLKAYLTGRRFYPGHLDVIFTHGVHVDPDYECGILSFAFYSESHINAIRWLIRHGVHSVLSLDSVVYRMMDMDFILVRSAQEYEFRLLEVLLQVGIKPSDSLKVNLGELELIIQAHLQQEDSEEQDDDIVRKAAPILHNIINKVQLTTWCGRRKVFPVDTEKQMSHLREFSDCSLDVYPEELKIADEKRKRWEQALMMISNMLHFLNQPKTLQWHCRVCLRESLVSLSPSVIRTLSVPAALKRYILCHEL